MLTKTDILVLRLEPDQADGIIALDPFMRPAPDDDERDFGHDLHGLVSKLRSRLSRRRVRP
jgi:hypothetical protein